MQLSDQAKAFLGLFPDFKMPEICITELPSGILGYAVINENKVLLCEKGIKKDPIEAQDTLLHEIAHFLTHHLFGDLVLDHGAEWRSIAQKLGARPDQRQDSKTPIKTYYIYFNGQKSESVSKRMHSVIQSGRSKKWSASDWMINLT